MKALQIIFSLLLVLYAQAVKAETVYKGTDKQGNTIYSDQPLENGEKITVTPTPSFSLPPLSPTQTQTEQEATTPVVNYNLSIIAPKDQETFTNDIRSITVNLALTPKLQAGDKIHLVINGEPFGEYSESLTFTLNEFPRGAYKIQAVITAENEAKIIKAQSNTITVYQQRAIAKRNVAPQLAPQAPMAPQAP